VYLRGSVLGILYLYLLYNQFIHVSNVCIGGSNWYCVVLFLVYCCHSHLSLVVEIVMRWFLIFVQIYALLLIIYIVGCCVSISISVKVTIFCGYLYQW
jgi:hypothetical protein